MLRPILLFLCASVPALADPPKEKPLPGERVGGDWQDPRASKRLDTRVPTRLDTRLSPRTINTPLVAATSQITTDKDNGCARSGAAGTDLRCDPPK
jgi:hypothetical protein